MTSEVLTTCVINKDEIAYGLVSVCVDEGRWPNRDVANFFSWILSCFVDPFNWSPNAWPACSSSSRGILLITLFNLTRVCESRRSLLEETHAWGSLICLSLGKTSSDSQVAFSISLHFSFDWIVAYVARRTWTSHDADMLEIWSRIQKSKWQQLKWIAE